MQYLSLRPELTETPVAATHIALLRIDYQTVCIMEPISLSLTGRSAVAGTTEASSGPRLAIGERLSICGKFAINAQVRGGRVR